jgi:hypothetical protein
MIPRTKIASRARNPKLIVTSGSNLDLRWINTIVFQDLIIVRNDIDKSCGFEIEPGNRMHRNFLFLDGYVNYTRRTVNVVHLIMGNREFAIIPEGGIKRPMADKFVIIFIGGKGYVLRTSHKIAVCPEFEVVNWLIRQKNLLIATSVDLETGIGMHHHKRSVPARTLYITHIMKIGIIPEDQIFEVGDQAVRVKIDGDHQSVHHGKSGYFPNNESGIGVMYL